MIGFALHAELGIAYSSGYKSIEINGDGSLQISTYTFGLKSNE